MQTKSDSEWYTCLTWSITVRDIPWSHVDNTTTPDHKTQAFAEIIGKSSSGTNNYFLTPYYPFFYVSLPYEWTHDQCAKWVSDLKSTLQQSWLKQIQLLWRNRQPLHTCLSTRFSTVIKFTFPNLQSMKAFAKHLTTLNGRYPDLAPLQSRIWENPKAVPDALKVSMISHVKPCTWFQVPIAKCFCMHWTFTKHCDEWFVPSLDLFVPPTSQGTPETSITLLSFDLEVYSQSGKFPMAERNDPIITIGNSVMTLTNNQPSAIRNIMYCLNEVERDPNWKPETPEDDIPMEIHWFKTEKELLIQWQRDMFGGGAGGAGTSTAANSKVDGVDPDIVTGYNTHQFDWPYLAKRARLLNLPDTFYSFGRKLNDLAKFQLPSEEELKRRKEQKGKKLVQCPLNMYGRVVLDMMIPIKKIPGNPFKSYKLDTVAETLLNKHKVDLKPSQIFAYFRESKYKRYELTRYCAVDCILVLEIIVNQNTCTRELAMARHTCTDIAKVVSCGETLKCFNMLLCFGYGKKYVCNYTPPGKSVEKWVNNIYDSWGSGDDFGDGGGSGDEPKEKYKGATVIEPKVGYYRQPVIVTDFASKYPTIMKSRNLCSSTFIGTEAMALQLEPWLQNRSQSEWSDNKFVQFDPNTYFRSFWLLKLDRDFINPNDSWHELRPDILKVVNGPTDSSHSFQWSYFATSFVGLSSESIAYLFAERAKFKKQMKQAKSVGDKLAASIADADQLGVKLIANSDYGMFGANEETGRLPCRRVAMSVTSIGREELELAKTMTEQKFNTVVISGDTDSLFFFAKEYKASDTEMDVRMAFKLGEQVATYITDTVFQGKAQLALEKVFFPFVVPMKKKYNGAMFEPDKDKDGKFIVGKPKQKATGTITNKIDFCDVHKEIFATMIQYMIMENNPKKAYLHLVLSLERMANNWYPLEKFISRNKLSDKDNTDIKAVVIRNKIKSRLDGSEPKPGDIVPFVYVRVQKDKAKVMERIEDPEFVKENNLILDLAHYISLLHAQIEPYFVRFPSLQVGKLFDKAVEVSKSYGSQFSASFFTSGQQSSQFSRFMDGILRLHLQQLQYKHIEEILQIWSTHFVWHPIPLAFHRQQVTQETLWSELDKEMLKAEQGKTESEIAFHNRWNLGVQLQRQFIEGVATSLVDSMKLSTTASTLQKPCPKPTKPNAKKRKHKDP